MKIALIVTAFVSLTLLGCGKWETDPMSGKSVGNGTLKPQVPIQPKPTADSAIIFETVSNHTFKENQADGFAVTNRVLEAGYPTSADVIIVNAADFPGASLGNGKFNWTPPLGTVKVSDGQYRDMTLILRAIAQGSGLGPISKETSVLIRVNKIMNSPNISMGTGADKVREGETLKVNITVTDLDASVNDPATWPMIAYVGVPGKNSIANFVSTAGMTAGPNGRFDVIAAIDLKDLELTSSVKAYSFGVKAISRFGMSSQTTNKDVTVLTSLADPVSTWTDNVPATLGTHFNYSFLVMDPKGEAKIDANINFTGQDPLSTIVCKAVSASVVSCTMNWDVPATLPLTRVSIRGTITVKNSNASDAYSKNRDIVFNIIPQAALLGGGQ